MIITRKDLALRIFLSHSSRDAEVAEHLVAFLLRALQLENRDIFCTGVEGHGLPAGVDVNERLRYEVDEADVLIGLLTPESLRSMYVAFELGARWGARRPMFPVLACGATPEQLTGPLSTIHCLDSASDSDMHGLVEQVSSSLDIPKQQTSTYTKQLQIFRDAAAKQQSSSTDTVSHPLPIPQPVRIFDDVFRLLREAADVGYITLTDEEDGVTIRTGTRILARAGNDRAHRIYESALNELTTAGYVSPQPRYGTLTTIFTLTGEGRMFLKNNPGPVLP